MRVWRVGLRVEAAGEDHARHLLLEQQVDIVRLGHAPDRLRAQHRREPLLREGAADHLGEGREDRVLELWQDEPDKTGTFAAELGGPLVAQDIERGQDRLTVDSDTPAFSLRTRLTVASLTPTLRATSASRLDMSRYYDERAMNCEDFLQWPQGCGRRPLSRRATLATPTWGSGSAGFP